MSNELAKMALLSLLPPGSAWRVKDNGDWDALLEGQATNWESVREDLDTLSEIRNPLTTPILSDLEKEYGVTPNPDLTEAIRRQRLAALVYAPNGTGSASYLQARLREAGFDVYVHANDPAVDPVPYLDQLSGAQLGEPLFQLGEEYAALGSYTSELIVAGDISRNELDFIAQCGINAIQCGAAGAVCGSADFDISPIEYPDPTNADRWRYVFFVGGLATRELVKNGTFDANIDSWKKLGNGALSWDASGYLQIDNGSVSDAQTYAYQAIPLDSSKSYTLTGRSRESSGEPVVRQSDDPTTPGTILFTHTFAPGLWQSFSVPVDPANGKYLQVGNSFTTPGHTCFFDDLSIIDNTATSVNIGEIQSINSAQIDASRRDEFLTTVTKWKPMHTWGIAIVEYI
jgi:hypothetical protein